MTSLAAESKTTSPPLYSGAPAWLNPALLNATSGVLLALLLALLALRLPPRSIQALPTSLMLASLYAVHAVLRAYTTPDHLVPTLTALGSSVAAGAALILLVRWMYGRPRPHDRFVGVARRAFTADELRRRAEENADDLRAWGADMPWWRLENEEDGAGRQVWVYDGEDGEDGYDSDSGDLNGAFGFDRSSNPNASDLLYRRRADMDCDSEANGGKGGRAGKKKTTKKKPGSVRGALAAGIEYYAKLQHADGHWPGDYGGPMFLMPGLVIVSYITGHDLGAPRRRALIAYLLQHQQTDGGWGIHIEGDSTFEWLNALALLDGRFTGLLVR